MNKEILVFYDNDICKGRFYYSKNPIMIYNVDIEKILISDKVSFDEEGFQYFTCYKLWCL